MFYFWRNCAPIGAFIKCWFIGGGCRLQGPGHGQCSMYPFARWHTDTNSCSSHAYSSNCHSLFSCLSSSVCSPKKQRGDLIGRVPSASRTLCWQIAYSVAFLPSLWPARLVLLPGHDPSNCSFFKSVIKRRPSFAVTESGVFKLCF